MSTTIAGSAIGSPPSNMFVGNSGEQLLSLWADVKGVTPANIFPEVFKPFRNRILLSDILKVKGMVRDLPANDLTVISEIADKRPIKLKSAVSSSEAGAQITIVLHASNYEGTKKPVQKRDKFLIPARYLADGLNNSAEYIILADTDMTTGTLAGDTIVLTPLSTLSAIGTDGIPAGTELARSGNAWARGEGQPKGEANIPVSQDFTWGIVKKTVGIEQQVLATKHGPIAYQGKNWYINDMIMKAERDLDFDTDCMLHHGQKNSNTSVLVGESQITGDDGVLRSCDGLTTLLDAYGMCDYYDTTFETSHISDVVNGFISQGVAPGSIGVYNGLSFWNNISDVMRDIIATYSGGTDMYDKVKNSLGISPTSLNWNGFDFNFCTVSTLSNPSNIGLTSGGEDLYEYGASAIFISDNPVTSPKFGTQVDVSIPNIGIGRVNYNGENDGKVTGILKGMTNLVGGNLGTDAAGLYYYWMATAMLFAGNLNQVFYFRKQK